jgi:hypothetical protein
MQNSRLFCCRPRRLSLLRHQHALGVHAIKSLVPRLLALLGLGYLLNMLRNVPGHSFQRNAERVDLLLRDAKDGPWLSGGWSVKKLLHDAIPLRLH